MKRPNSPSKTGLTFETWKTPFGADRLGFEAMIQLEEIHFLIRGGGVLYCISIPRRSPFRVMDESYMGQVTDSLAAATKKKASSSSWKLRGSPFLRELEETVLFHKAPEKSKYSYLVLTGDECLEFVSPEPKIKQHKGKTAEQVLKSLI